MNKDFAYIEASEHRIFTSLSVPSDPRSDRLTLALLHGAGKSHSGAYQELIEQFTQRGVAVVALDFVGHGQTGGDIGGNSLSLRTAHTLASIEYWVDQEVPLIIMGSSMSGHTALRVTSILGDRVKSLGLLQPAVYAPEAEDVFFGPEFSSVIRQPESWKSSLALINASNFQGKSLVAIGRDDSVIPRAVVDHLELALKKNSKQLRLCEIEGVGHELPTWLPRHPEILDSIIEFLTNMNGV